MTRTWLMLCRRLPKPARARLTPGVEELEARRVLSGYAPTGVEQEFLERLNDARANPAAYGRSIGLDLSGVTPSQPLAFNPSLVQSSRDHSQDMNVHNFFGHNGSDGSNPFQRMMADGFPLVGAAESIAAGYATPEAALAGLIIDAGEPGVGHRLQLLSIGGSPYQQEQQTGVGIILNGSGAYRNYYTIDTGYTADTRPFLTGSVFDDLNHNGLYDNGEGLGGVTITAVGTGGTFHAVTWGSGGYSLLVPPGTYTVTAAGGALGAPISRAVGVGGANVRLSFTPPTGITTTVLTSGANPSRAGQAVTFTATVTGGGIAGTPTGTVEFFDGATDLGPGGALTGSGNRARSVFVTSALSAGTHALKAVYAPDGVFRGSQGTLTQAVRADHLAFSVQPGDAVAGVPLAPAVRVQLLDPSGNLQTGDNSDQVTITIAGGPGAFAAGSTTTVTAKGGVATFDHLILTAAGRYTLKATATGGITGPNSAAFTVSPAAADHLAFSVQPSLVVVGQVISPAVRVRVLDRFGNLLADDNSDQVTLSVAAGPGAFTADSTTVATVSGGVATFDNLALTASGSYTLGATATGGLTGPNSAAFTVALVTDGFNRPSAPTLGPGWSVLLGAPAVAGNRLLIGGSASALAVVPAVARADVGVQATIALPAAGTQFAGLVARYAGPGVNNFYLGEIIGAGGRYTAYLYRRQGAAFVQLGQAVPVATGTGTLRLEVVGNSLKLFLNGRLLSYAFDSVLTTGTVGVWGRTGAALDNFEADAINRLAVALPYHDGFALPAGGQLSRGWAERMGNFQAQGNGRLRAAGAGPSVATLNLAPVADVAVQANVALPASGSQYAGLAARYSGTGDGRMYWGAVVGNNGSFVAVVYRHVGASWTMLASRALPGGTGLLRFVVKGSRLQLSWNGTVVCDLTDTAIAGPGLIGLRATQGALYANFSASLNDTSRRPWPKRHARVHRRASLHLPGPPSPAMPVVPRLQHPGAHMSLRRRVRPSRSARKPAPARSVRRSPLLVEQLEDRTALSPLIPVTNHRDLVYDPYRNMLYITAGNGTVQQYNVTTQQLTAPLSVGTSLASADITNDGTTLIVAEQQTAGSQEVLHRINLNTLTRNDMYYPSAPGEGGWGLALGPGSKGLLTDMVPNNLPGPMRYFDAVTGQEVFRYDDPGSAGGGGVGSGTVIRHGADRSLLLVTEGTVSYGQFFSYSPQTDTFSRPYALGVPLTGALTAVNRNGTLLAMEANGTTTIFSTVLQRIVVSFPGMDGGVAFDPGQDVLYGVMSNGSQIVAYNTNTWTYQFGMPVGEAVPRGTALGNGVMTVSTDGRWLFLATPSGVREYPLPTGSGPAVRFVVNNLPNVATAGTPFSYTLTATDSGGRVATGYVGTVHFVSTDPQAVLPADYTFRPTDLGQHTFTVTLKTAGQQRADAYDVRTGMGTMTSPVPVVPGAVANFQLTTGGATDPQPAGYGFGVLVTAFDAYGNLAYNYTGKVHFTSTDASAQLPPDYTFTGADQGRRPFNVTLNKAGSQTVTVTDTAKVSPPATPAKGSVTVNVANFIPGLHFTFTAPTTTPTAGAPLDLKVTAYDQYNQVAKRYVGTITFTTSDAGAGVALPQDYTFTAADAGMHTFAGGATLVTAGDQTITLHDTAYLNAGGGGATYTTLNLTVIPAAASTFTVSGFPASVTAGDAGTFTVTAYDAYGNVATDYAGTVHFSSSDAQAALPADATLTNGSGTFSATLKTAGAQGLTAADAANSGLSGSQAGITVSPAAASVLVLSAPSTVTAGVPFTVTVTLLDAYGNVATGYVGTVHLVGSDPLAELPPDYTFTADDAGAYSFSATFWTVGGQSLTATDGANGLGGTLGIDVLPS